MAKLKSSSHLQLDNADAPEKLCDFLRNPKYERRVVAFYDVLGWRDEINKAGSDAEKIGNLRRMILQHARMLRLPSATPVNVSTFSDNVVISTEVGKSVPYFLRALAITQLMTVSHGFLLRGGVAVGDIVHDDEVVFGPALNRAYELESKTANFPRIVIDPPVLKISKIEGFHSFEDNVFFLDPFTVDFIHFMFQDARKT